MSLLTSESSRASDHLSSASICSDVYSEFSVRRRCVWKKRLCIRSMKTTENQRADVAASQNGPLNTGELKSPFEVQPSEYSLGKTRVTSHARRKTKIVCTIGPSTSSREMIWKLAEAGMNVTRLNLSYGDHASHQKTIDLVKEYNSRFEDKVVAIMLDTKGPEVRSGDIPQPIILKEGQEFNFTIQRGVSTQDTVSVNYE